MTALKTLRLLGVAIVILAQVRTGFAYSSGAPATACSDMTPRHGGTKPTTPAPFRVTVTPGTFGPGDVLEGRLGSFFYLPFSPWVILFKVCWRTFRRRFFADT